MDSEDGIGASGSPRTTRLADGQAERHAAYVANSPLEEEALRRSEQFIRSIAFASPHWFYVFDLDDMDLSYENRSILHDLGYPGDLQQTITGLDAFREFMPQEEMSRLHRLIEEWHALPDGTLRDDEYCLRHADGTLHYALTRIHRLTKYYDRRRVVDKPRASFTSASSTWMCSSTVRKAN